ncbi:MAG TPA: dTDP-4-dehydrorhamnose 3,5-epimerase family protein [Acidimicrobiia bacterium]|nr:dTDP-4-dehydrorhamnose 3,5-epimerase family protein [Acidimicrobiia bacterium]
MRFLPTEIAGAFIVELEPRADDRGFFARAFSVTEFAAHGLEFGVRNANTTHTRTRGTLRGLHYQLPPAAEDKLIRCTRGAVYSVLVDLRPGSPTRFQHIGVELTAENRLALLIPGLCAAGALTLADDTETFYLVTADYSPELERGVRYDDPALGIEWPIPVTTISEKDRSWPDIDLNAIDMEDAK